MTVFAMNWVNKNKTELATYRLYIEILYAKTVHGEEKIRQEQVSLWKCYCVL